MAAHMVARPSTRLAKQRAQKGRFGGGFSMRSLYLQIFMQRNSMEASASRGKPVAGSIAAARSNRRMSASFVVTKLAPHLCIESAQSLLRCSAACSQALGSHQTTSMELRMAPLLDRSETRRESKQSKPWQMEGPIMESCHFQVYSKPDQPQEDQV